MPAFMRSRRTWTVLGLAVGVGIAVDMIARSIAGASCPTEEVLVPTSCADLVESLSARIGVAAGIAVLFMELLSVGLLRTWSAIEADRGTEGEPVS